MTSSKLTAPVERHLWNRAKEGAKVIVATTDAADARREKELRGGGVEVLRAPAAEGRVDLRDLFRQLIGDTCHARHGLTLT